jgi:hypothetical protein
MWARPKKWQMKIPWVNVFMPSKNDICKINQIILPNTVEISC